MLKHLLSVHEFYFAGRAVSNNFNASTFGFFEHFAWEAFDTAFLEYCSDFLHSSYCFGLRHSVFLLHILMESSFAVLFVHFLAGKVNSTGLALELAIRVLADHGLFWLDYGGCAKFFF